MADDGSAPVARATKTFACTDRTSVDTAKSLNADHAIIQKKNGKIKKTGKTDDADIFAVDNDCNIYNTCIPVYHADAAASPMMIEVGGGLVSNNGGGDKNGESAAPTTMTTMTPCCPSWDVDEIVVPIATSLEDDTPIEYNLAQSIGTWSHGNEGRKLYLPSFLNQNDEIFRRQQLSPYFRKPCSKLGFNVSMGWERAESKVIFRCTHNYKFNRQINCAFRFLVYWDQTNSRWFLKEFGAGHRTHSGHRPKGQEPESVEDDNSSSDDEESTSSAALNDEESQQVHAMLCRGEALMTLGPLVEDVANLLDQPEHFVEFRSMLLKYKKKQLRRHKLVDTDEMEKNGNFKPRKKRKICDLCKISKPQPLKTKTFRICKVCRIPICTNEQCLQKHRESVLVTRRYHPRRSKHDL